MATETAAIVLCAGKGTRMYSKTSKLLHPLCGQPICYYPLDAITKAIKGPVVAVIGHQADEVKAAIESRYGDRVQFAVQPNQLGTGNAVAIGLEALGNQPSSVIVMCGDTPLLQTDTLEHLIQWQRRQQLSVAMLTTKTPNPTGYGRIIRNQDGDIAGIIEEKDATYQQRRIQEINPGVYAFDAAFLKEALPLLTPQNSKHEYYLTDVVQMATRKQGTVAGVEVTYNETIGINDRQGLAIASKILYAQTAEKAMLAGVTCEDPHTTYIDSSVQLGEDVLLGQGVILKGNTKIADNVVIGPYSVITDCQIATGTHIQAHSVCEGAIIGKEAQIGPFARLRPETKLDAKVRIGNFVEVKKSHFKEGSKANHLAYIGDASVGHASNVGAGTITCNYDGFHKHTTVIEDEVFIGSNSTLVAPVCIEKKAYVAAGSVVTEQVPQDALALGRARQINKPGYAKKIRDKLKS